MEKLKSILKYFLACLKAWWISISSWTINEQIGAFLGNLAALIAALLILLGLCGCSTVKYVPIESETKVIQKDSLIYVRDTITIEVPKEIIKEIVPADTTSYLETSVAKSEARLEKGQLHHSLEQSGTIKTIVDTCYVTRVEEKVVYQDRPVEVPKEIKHIPSWAWWSLIFNIVTLLFVAFKIYLKLKP